MKSEVKLYFAKIYRQKINIRASSRVEVYKSALIALRYFCKFMLTLYTLTLNVFVHVRFLRLQTTNYKQVLAPLNACKATVFN